MLRVLVSEQWYKHVNVKNFRYPPSFIAIKHAIIVLCINLCTNP